MPLGSTLLCILRGEYMLINEVCKSTGLTKKAILYPQRSLVMDTEIIVMKT